MSSLIHKFNTIFKTQRIFWIKFAHSPFFKYLPDKMALEIQFQNIFHRRINWDEPKAFNEKLQWLKLYDRKERYSTMVDKYEVKKYVADIIGEEHVIPTLGVWDRFEDIDFDLLPDQFVLKCTHGSGDVVICKDKKNFDIDSARITLQRAMNIDYYKISREWPYKNVKRRIIAEKYMEVASVYDSEKLGAGLIDYKFFCFGGIPKIMFVATDRAVDCKFDYYDMDFNHLPIVNIHENSGFIMNKPKHFEEMKNIAKTLSEGYPFLRIDLYEINDTVYFGEYTFYHAGGFSRYYPEIWDYKLGEWLNLPEKQTNKS